MAGVSETVPALGPRRNVSILPPGTMLGRFVVVRLIGMGGMGAVYEARDPELSRSVAVKLLFESRGRGDGMRLLREAQALAQLQHPNVVSLHDVGVDEGGRVFIAMEYVDGQTLDVVLRETAPGWRAVVSLFLQAGRGLAAAHARSLVHRDFKPGNVLVDREERVRVTDFGLARLARDEEPAGAGPAGDQAASASSPSWTTMSGDGEEPAPTPTPASDVLAMSLTAAGAVVGTPRYMSPEQRAGAPASQRSDQYSFCVALWEALLGELPPATGRAAALPRPLVAALEVGLAAAPEARHPSMATLLAALERAVAGPAARRRRALLAGAILVAGGSAAAAAVGMTRSGVRCDRAGAAAQAAWTPGARAAVAVALDRARPDAPAAAPVLVRIDDYAAGWRAARVDACQATHERGEQSAVMLDRRTACLDEGLVALRALVAGLVRVEGPGVDRALEAVDGLPRLDRCDAARLAGTAPVSVDPRAALALRGAAEADVAFRLGRQGEALVQAELALALARTSGEPALLARCLREYARVLNERDARQGRAALEEALVAAARSGDREIEADVVTRLLASLMDDGAADRVDALLPAARAAVAASRDPANGRALAAVEARILVKARRPPAEIRAACDAVAAFERPGDPPAAIECRCIAAVTARDVAQGRTQCGALVEARTAHFGALHPDVAFALLNLANILETAGDYAGALELAQRAEPIFRRAFGDGKRTTLVLISEGNLLDELGRPAESRVRFEHALEIIRRDGDRPTRRLATVLVSLSQVQARLGDREAALRHGDEAMTVAEAVLGSDNPELAIFELNWGQTLDGLGEHARSLAVFQRGAALAGKAMPDDVIHGLCLAGAAHDLSLLGRPREALPLAERALPIVAAAGTDPDNLAYAQTALGEALLATGDRRRARPALEAARAVYLTQGAKGAKALADVDRLLAR